MNFYIRSDPGRITFDEEDIVAGAERALEVDPFHITDAKAPLSEGGVHDYYSNGDYWWPNPDTPNGLPYVRRDGETNPDHFTTHRRYLREIRNHTATLAAACLLTGKEKYASQAELLLREFFLDEETKMNPHLLYGQAIPGRCSGRGVGIIDTLHLIDIPVAVSVLEEESSFSPEVASGLRAWFAEYLKWMSTHEYGVDEMNKSNNHGVCWHVQAAVFARFIDDGDMVDFCRRRYREVLLPEQMAEDGSFPRELERTKPYGYSIFVLDNMVTLCHVLSTPENNLWEFRLEDGRGIKKGLDYLVPYMIAKEKWPYPPDVQHFEGWPSRISFLLFAGVALKDDEYIELWRSLSEPSDPEVRRNTAIRQPILWLR